MLAYISNATYNTATGEIILTMPTSTINGYQNSVQVYQSANVLSMPNPNIVVNIEQQAATQVMVTGYENKIVDTNYTIQGGEHSSYSNNWYLSTRNAGIEAQQAQTANKENFMMGQSTNAVLSDIMSLLVNIISYLTTIEALYNTHVHTGVTTGMGSSGTTPSIWNTPPDDSDVVTDQTYISGNHNLAITGTYEPK